MAAGRFIHSPKNLRAARKVTDCELPNPHETARDHGIGAIYRCESCHNASLSICYKTWKLHGKEWVTDTRKRPRWRRHWMPWIEGYLDNPDHTTRTRGTQ